MDLQMKKNYYIMTREAKNEDTSTEMAQTDALHEDWGFPRIHGILANLSVILMIMMAKISSVSIN